MAFASGSVTFRRYRVIGCPFECIDDRFLEALTAHGFGRHQSAADDGRQIGWISPLHLFDVDFAAERVAAGPYAHFRMRLDRITPPASILKSYVEIEKLAALEASGRDYLTREEQRQARDGAAARANKEAASGAFRRISACPVLFDLEGRCFYAGSTSDALNDRIRALFEDTFDARLEPVTVHALAADLASELGLSRNFEDARPAHLVPVPDGIDGDFFTSDPADRGFLGREFLSWIWYRVDRAEGLFRLAGGNGQRTMPAGELAASIVTAAQLRCDFNLTGRTTIRTDAPTSVPEASAAIASGKQPTKLGLILGGSTGEWTLALDGLRFDVSGLTLPPSQQPTPAARLEERADAVVEAGRQLDALFATFLQTRLSSDWPAELGRMSAWAAKGRLGSRQARPRLVSA